MIVVMLMIFSEILLIFFKAWCFLFFCLSFFSLLYSWREGKKEEDVRFFLSCVPLVIFSLSFFIVIMRSSVWLCFCPCRGENLKKNKTKKTTTTTKGYVEEEERMLQNGTFIA
eukprot:TRINITY_DN710_c4_g1_i2.p1 TRINITY_DN710_c4_g1~~TRINITY_DN710_c4_g1_i2.p1  ORF type:complete len:113 (+),score=1.57 TRINITY_DN710_c4_g1_i2:185-523(+)